MASTGPMTPYCFHKARQGMRTESAGRPRRSMGHAAQLGCGEGLVLVLAELERLALAGALDPGNPRAFRRAQAQAATLLGSSGGNLVTIHPASRRGRR